jgi:hypothetical protein
MAVKNGIAEMAAAVEIIRRILAFAESQKVSNFRAEGNATAESAGELNSILMAIRPLVSGTPDDAINLSGMLQAETGSGRVLVVEYGVGLAVSYVDMNELAKPQ